jgi:hypothetical protein
MLKQSGITRNEYVELAMICIRPLQNGIYKRPSENQPINAKITKMKQLFTDNPTSQKKELDHECPNQLPQSRALRYV